MSGTSPRFSQWMSELPEHVTRVPISWLAIPGSHNSGTYDLDPSLGVAIDQQRNIQNLGTCCCTKSVVHKWSKTQNLTLPHQLEAGIRYFDIRLAAHPDTQELRFVHGLYGDLVLPVLREVSEFLVENPREVVIFDFRRFYGMTDEGHRKLLNELRNIFFGKLCPVASVGNLGTTLENIWKTPYRVIIIYHNLEIIENEQNIWSGFDIEAPWANTNKVSRLINFLEESYTEPSRENNVLHVWQGVVTARSQNIIFGPFSSLETSIATQATEAFVKWLVDKEAGQRGVNVCSADFVDKSAFIETVIGLNLRIQFHTV